MSTTEDIRYIGKRRGPTEHVTLLLRPDQIARLPSLSKARNSRIVALLQEGLAIDGWVTCPCCSQSIKPEDRPPYERVTARIPIPVARLVLERSMADQSKIAPVMREIIDRALQAEHTS